MKKIITLLLITVLLSSCPAESNEFIDLLFDRDREPPMLIEYELIENNRIYLIFSEPVLITDSSLDGNTVFRNSNAEKSIYLTFKEELKKGEEKTLFLSAEDKSGNTSRFAIKLSGINFSQCSLLITEVSMKGTDSSPDRIELTCTKSGSLLGYAIQDGITGYEKHRYYLPDIYLYKHDIVVIYWDRCSSLPSTLIRDREKTYYLFANSPETLIGTNGAVVLYNHTNGKGEIEDAFLYNTSDAESYEGYGNKASLESAKYLLSISEWYGKSFISDSITSSRVAARLYPYSDSNTAEDFYTTAARNSTFGYPNTNVKYVP